jgi:hypothetical protein
MTRTRIWFRALATFALCGAVSGGLPAEPQPPEAPKGVRLPFLSTLQQLWNARERTIADLDSVIEKFEVRDEDVPTAVGRLANEHNVLCGIAVLPWPRNTAAPSPGPPFKYVRNSFACARVRDILDRLVVSDPSFEWREADGVVNLALRGTFDNPGHPLNQVIPEFDVRDVPYPIALHGYPGWPVEALSSLDWAKGLDVGCASSGPGPYEYPPVTLSARQQSPLQIINEMARQLRLSWIIFDRKLVGEPTVWLQMGLELPATDKFRSRPRFPTTPQPHD